MRAHERQAREWTDQDDAMLDAILGLEKIWEERGGTGGEPRELTAASADELYAALLEGTVSRSADGGASWEKLLTP